MTGMSGLHCPRCQQPLIRSTTLVEGSVVLGCRWCRQFCVEGSDKWVPSGDGFRESLRVIAATVKAEHQIVKMIMESPIDDPRWEQWM